MNRRRFLALATIGTGLLSGCNESSESSTPTATREPTPTRSATTTATPESLDIDLAWESLVGPPGGPVTDMSISPTDPDWMYATTQTAGMYVSSDGGQRWTQGTEAMHHRANVWVSPHDPAVAYSLYDRTTDGGRTWSTKHTGAVHDWYPDVHSVNDLAFDPHDQDTLFVATDEGLYRTSDGGSEWTRCPVSGSPDGRAVRQVAVHPEREGVLAAGVSNDAVFMSGDRGETWTTVEGTSEVVHNIPRLLVFAGPDSTDLYFTINGGGVFRAGEGDLESIADGIDPLIFPYFGNSDPLSAGGDRLYFVASQDAEPPPWQGFHLFVYDREADELSTLETPEKPVSVTAHPTDPSTVYLGGISGVHESQDRGRTWERLANGFQDGYLSAVGVNPTRSGTVMAGTICSGGLFVSADGGETFDWNRSGLSPFHGGAFNEHYVMHIAARDDRAYATTAAGLLISTDNGGTWRLLENEFSGSGSIAGHGDHPAMHLHGLAVSPDDPQTVYVGTGLGGPGDPDDAFDGVSHVWRSVDGGDSWRELAAGFPTDTDTVVQDILVSRHDTGVVYAGTNDSDYLGGGSGPHAGEAVGVYRWTEADGRWEPLPTPFSSIHALAEDPAEEGRLFAATPLGLYRRDAPDEEWTSVLLGDAKALLTHPSVPNVVFTGIRRSEPYWDLLVSLDGGDTWGMGGLTIQVGRAPDERDYDGIDPHADYRPAHGEIIWLALDEGTTTLFAATRAAGLWRADTGGLVSQVARSR